MPEIDKTDIPQNPIERGYWVIMQLKMRGVSLRSLALKRGVLPQSLSLALRAPNLPGETVIAAELGLEPTVLFKDRYTPTGERLFRVRNRSVAKSGRNAKARGVA